MAKVLFKKTNQFTREHTAPSLDTSISYRERFKRLSRRYSPSVFGTVYLTNLTASSPCKKFFLCSQTSAHVWCVVTKFATLSQCQQFCLSVDFTLFCLCHRHLAWFHPSPGLIEYQSISCGSRVVLMRVF